MCIETLRNKGIEPTAFWYNNNIHPFTEYRARRDAMKAYAQSIDLPLIVEDEYGLRAFVQAVADNIAARCVFCYRSRLERTAQEAAARNVTVNAVAPGFIDTDMTKDLPQDELKQLVPMKRFGKSEEVAALVAFLCSEDAGYITGEVISINGGLYT